MSDMTIRLVDGKEWVEILPFGSRLGEVVDGTVCRRGDWIERPNWLTWKEAAQADSAGNTLLGPSDLELVCDAVTGWQFVPEADEDAVARAAQSQGDERPVLDEDLARALSRALASGDEEAKENPGLRQRKNDEAA